MRKSAIVVLLCACLTAVVALTVAGLTGCGNPQRSMFCKTDRPQYLLELRRAEPTAAMAHGGQATVNAAAYDAMFFKHYGVNPAIDTDEDNLSTFAMDVDTGSYTVCRRYLQDNNVPPEEAVRVEEFINYFGYNYAPPETPNEDFAIHLAAAPSQFGKGRTLLRVGLKAREVQAADQIGRASCRERV